VAGVSALASLSQTVNDPSSQFYELCSLQANNATNSATSLAAGSTNGGAAGSTNGGAAGATNGGAAGSTNGGAAGKAGGSSAGAGGSAGPVSFQCDPNVPKVCSSQMLYRVFGVLRDQPRQPVRLGRPSQPR
jgi:hypothetical protein